MLGRILSIKHHYLVSKVQLKTGEVFEKSNDRLNLESCVRQLNSRKLRLRKCDRQRAEPGGDTEWNGNPGKVL